MLERDTPWRQGSLVSTEHLLELEVFLPSGEEGSCWGVIISHDCDLRHQDEPCLELIVARVIPTIDPTCTHAKHVRQLHLTFHREEREDLCVSLKHLNRVLVCKDRFAKLGHSETHSLNDSGKRTLKEWLAVRYSRLALPSALEKRFRCKGKKTVFQRIKRILKPMQDNLTDVFLDLGVDGFKELAPEDPYWLQIYLVYQNGTEAREEAHKAAAQISEMFTKVFGQLTELGGRDCVVLDSCRALPNTEISLFDLGKLVRWGFEFLSLEEEDEGDFMPAGAFS